MIRLLRPPSRPEEEPDPFSFAMLPPADPDDIPFQIVLCPPADPDDIPF